MIKLKLGQSCLTVNVSPDCLVRKHMTAILIKWVIKPNQKTDICRIINILLEVIT